ncbi:MAG: hypothetical protein JWN44_5101 [Myxococcales bacterium]|nr:hypothetical protein [Myxococcales bacterium]
MRSLVRAVTAATAVFAGSASLLIGCDTLFPEFGGSKPPPDMAMSDAATTSDGGDPNPRLAGVVCILTDLRDYRTCAIGSPGMLRITVEETRQQVMTDFTGHFTMPLSMKLQVATVAAIDPNGMYPPTIMPVRLSNDGVLTSLALPVVSAQTLSNVALQNGATMDPLRGTLIAWAIDPTGTPLANVAANANSAVFDDVGQNQLSAGSGTRLHGAVGIFGVAPTILTLTLTPPATAAVRADTFTIPIRAGALTATTLILPPR